MKSFPDDFRERALLRIGHVINKKYRLDILLGVGGMAAVYAATHRNQNRVAIKILHDRLADDKRIQKLFRREAYVANKVEHPDAVGVLDDDVTEGGCAFLVLPLLQGETLQKRWELKGRHLEVREVVLLARSVLDVLSVAHASSVVHRDIKPENLFLTCDGSLKLLDFGIARVSEGSDNAALTRSGCVIGTPAFMPPEQSLGRSKLIDGRSDIWALGATMFTLMTGCYARDRGCDGLYEATKPVRLLRSVAPEIPESIALVVDKALAVEKEDRWADAASMRQALTEAFVKEYGSEQSDLKTLILNSDPPVSVIDRCDPHNMQTCPQKKVIEAKTAPRNNDPKLPPPDLGYLATEIDGRARHLDQAKELLGSVLGGQYRLQSVIGVGGMGAVFEAQDGRGTTFAVKTLLPGSCDLAGLGIRRFVREAQAMISINNPYVLRVFEAAADLNTNLPFIVMERLHGCDLGQLVASRKRLEPGVATRILWEASQGLSVVHKDGMVHRDIKPSNIFLHRESDGRVITKLCDLGIAKHPGGNLELTHTGMMLGSPLYMAPEQAQNARLADVRSDVWGMAMTLYQALSGEHPLVACKTLGEILKCLYTMEVTPLQQVAPWIDAALAEVVHRGLQREPRDRYESASEFGKALEPFCAKTRLDAEILPPTQPPLAIGSMDDTHDDIAVTSVPPIKSRRWQPLAVALISILGAAGAWGWLVYATSGSHEALHNAFPLITHDMSALPARSVIAAPGPLIQAATDEPKGSDVSGEPSGAKAGMQPRKYRSTPISTASSSPSGTPPAASRDIVKTW